MNMTGHDADLTLTRRDHPRTVGTNKPDAQLIAFFFSNKHIQRGNTLRDTHD